MLLRPAFFLLVLALACLYAARRGGMPERLAAAAMAAAAAATAALPTTPSVSFRAVEWAELGIDLVLLAALVGLACTANRFWLIWAAAIHLDTIAVHAVRALDPRLLPGVYAAGLGWAAYPVIGLLVIGTARHGARRRGAGDPDWSPVRWR